MRNKRGYIILLIVILFLIGLFFVASIIQKNNPLNIIESKMKLKLSSGSEIIGFYYNRGDEFFLAKVQINDQDVENLKAKLINIFKYEYTYENVNSIPNFQNNASWWDMDKSKIEVCYFKFISGEKYIFKKARKSIELWAFIVKQSDNKYYLYLAY